jgi:hypothetical protein
MKTQWPYPEPQLPPLVKGDLAPKWVVFLLGHVCGMLTAGTIFFLDATGVF